MVVQDDDMDPMERIDAEESEESEKEDSDSILTDGGAVAPLDLPVSDPEHIIADVLDKIIEPEVISKNKANMLPRNLIEKPLEPDDWCDDGCI